MMTSQVIRKLEARQLRNDPDDVPAELRGGLLDRAIMGPPVVWLASNDAAPVHDEHIIATDFDDRLARR